MLMVEKIIQDYLQQNRKHRGDKNDVLLLYGSGFPSLAIFLFMGYLFLKQALKNK